MCIVRWSCMHSTDGGRNDDDEEAVFANKNMI